jgi:ArsR family transcriptional regulator
MRTGVRVLWIEGREFMKTKDEDVARYAQMLSAMGTEPRLRIMRLLLSAHPEGMIVMDIQAELGIPGSTLSHHLEKLKHVGLTRVQRESCCLRYSADNEALQELLAFLYEECCSRSHAGKSEKRNGRGR